MTRYRQVGLDENAKRILDETKAKLRKKGINASLSDAIRHLYEKQKRAI